MKRHTLILGLLSGVAGSARGDGVAPIMTTKSIPASTVAVIDPETGSSTGAGSGTDVRISPGDIIAFRVRYLPVPDNNGALDGMGGWITEYVPNNTQVVGVRILSDDVENAITLVPRYPGISVDSTSGGSISRLHGDTGIFLASHANFRRDPLAEFLRLDNGMIVAPRQASNIAAIVGLSGSPRSHNAWDTAQVNAYGVNGGLTPAGQGSPVAGPGTHYKMNAGTPASPWQRIRYPGSLIGYDPTSGGGGTRRTVRNVFPPILETLQVNALTGVPSVDVTPASPSAATAVRFAIGDLRVGRPGVAEIFLKKVATGALEQGPGTMNADVSCAEIFGGDSAKRSPSDTGTAPENMWATFLPSPACVFLNLLFDLRVSNQLAVGQSQLTWTLTGSNLSTLPQTGVQVFIGYNSSRGSVTGTTPGATQVSCPAQIGQTGLTCQRWTLGTLAPGADYTRTVSWTVGGGGQQTNVFRALYLSDQLSGGYTTQEVALVVATPVLEVTIPSPTTATPNMFTALMSSGGGGIVNSGSGMATLQQMSLFLPPGWTARNINIAGADVECAMPAHINREFETEVVCANIPQAIRNLGPGSNRTLAFEVQPPTGTPAGLYPIHASVWMSASSFGGEAENFFDNIAIIPVGQVRSAPPGLTCGAGFSTSLTSISGTSSEANGTIIRVYFNGVFRGQTTVTNQQWTFTGFVQSFGPLYGGLEVFATADSETPNELESVPSARCTVVQAPPACADNLDNDGDGLIDFPDDPGCASFGDNDESNPVFACSDGVDNDGDGRTDWPADPGCYGPDDPSETHDIVNGAPACSDGRDNDMDGKIDFPDDPGCHSPNDSDEADPNMSPIDVLPRLLLVVDTSGSMNYNTCAATGDDDDPLGPLEFTGGDGSTECRGSDVACSGGMCSTFSVLGQTHEQACFCASPGCGNGMADDSRFYKVKVGMSNVIAGFGEVQFALMRFIQRAVPFACPIHGTSPSGGWLGAGRSCAGANGGEVLVRFSDNDNRYDLLEWLNHSGSSVIGHDFELRGSGTTPIAGSLASALTYLTAERATDDRVACRPYRVILLTDGKESCPAGNPMAAAGALRSAGFLVNVIGFATTNPTIVTQLNAIANSGGTGSAIFVDNEAALSAAIAQIVSEVVLDEECNGMDDNCNGLCDEGYGVNQGGVCGSAPATCSVGVGACRNDGFVVCTGPFTSACNAVAGAPGTEVCNGIDDDCDGLVDEGLSCPPCFPEVCNGIDDDCDGMIDENVPGVGQPCGLTTGQCEPGALVCRGADGLVCEGGRGPSTEICDGLDNDCDGIVDSLIELCYPPATPGCTQQNDGTYACLGVCTPGLRSCIAGTPGACTGVVTPSQEICDGLDNDCDGVVDNGFNTGECFSPGIGACRTRGEFICTADGMGTFCTAPTVQPTEEICNGVDDDCDGEIDEGTLGAPIGLPCGGVGGCLPGVFVCDPSGQIICSGQGGSGTPEVCDGQDNDCDGFIDEEPLPGSGVACPPPGLTLPLQGTCAAGEMRCVPDGTGGASLECVGFVGPSPEICDGIDNNCDGMVDNMAICPDPEDACFEGSCVSPCGPGEFPCGSPFHCKDLPGLGRYCVVNPCEANGVVCEPGFSCNTDTGVCEDMCVGVTCVAPRTCLEGRCVDCFVTGCAPPMVCRAGTTGPGTCVPDPCAGVSCGDDEFCREGQCVALTCTPACADGSVCIDGECRTLTCDLENCLGRQCALGQACDPTDGRCISDPCIGTDCPSGFRCRVSCGAVAICEVDVPLQPPGVDVLATGGGGFSCAVGGGDRSAGAGWLLLGLAFLVFRRRRR